MGELLGDLGEFGLINRLVGRLAGAPGVLVGPGDDCAVLEIGGSAVLFTADLLLEGRHFDLAISTPGDVGNKALMVNVSDVAAMGGVPRHALVSLGAPAGSPVQTIEGIYDGLAEASRETGVSIAGGDTVRAERIVLSVALLGEPPVTGAVLRSGARPGDALCVTGTLGAAAAGLWLLRRDDADAHDLLERHPDLARAHRRARARVREGIAAAARGALAMIDVSDGFAQDVGHVCEASDVGVDIDGAAVPAASGAREAAALCGKPDPALFGGDDYELAIAIAPQDVEGLRAAIAPTPLAAVGVFSARAGVRVDGEPVANAGWDHFGSDL